MAIDITFDFRSDTPPGSDLGDRNARARRVDVAQDLPLPDQFGVARHLRRQRPRALTIPFRPIAAEAERVIAVRADLAAIAEPRRMLAAAETRMTFVPDEAARRSK